MNQTQVSSGYVVDTVRLQAVIDARKGRRHLKDFITELQEQLPGISYDTFRRVLGGQVPSLSTYIMICLALDQPFDTLLRQEAKSIETFASLQKYKTKTTE